MVRWNQSDSRRKTIIPGYEIGSINEKESGDQ